MMTPAKICFLLSLATAAVHAGDVPIADPDYGDSGIARIGFDFGGNPDYGSDRDLATAAALGPDGRLVIAGNVQLPSGDTLLRFDWGIGRLLTIDGSPDPSFGDGDGHTDALGLVPIEGFGSIADVDTSADGRSMLLGNYATSATENPRFIVFGRLDAAGEPDPTFDFDGYRILAATTFLNSAVAGFAARMRVQPDGKILAMVDVTDNATVACAGLIRLNADGSTDTSFGGGDGSVCISSDAAPMAVFYGGDFAMLPDGKILIAGTGNHPGSSIDMGVVRLDADGTLDTAFGNGGRAFVAFDQGGGLTDTAQALAVDADGRIVIAGMLESLDGYAMGVARLAADGQIDASFGSQGRVQIAFDPGASSEDDRANAVVCLADGRILVGGSTSVPFNTGAPVAALAMLKSNGALDATFGDGGMFVQTTQATPTWDQLTYPTRMLLSGDYVYLTGSAGKVNSSNLHATDFASTRYVLPLFRDGFDTID